MSSSESYTGLIIITRTCLHFNQFSCLVINVMVIEFTKYGSKLNRQNQKAIGFSSTLTILWLNIRLRLMC